MLSAIFDFETRSAVDLAKVGPWKYAAHPSTEITALGVKLNNGPGRVWLPPWVKELLEVYAIPSGKINTYAFRRGIDKVDRWVAHNVEFERAIWHYQMHLRYGFPDLSLDKCDCTAARASVHALPRKLESVCQVLNLTAEKDMAGHALMLKMCKPRKPRKAEREELLSGQDGGLITEIDDKTFYHSESGSPFYFWHETPEQLIGNIEYCLADLEAEYELDKVVLPFSPAERQIWLHDQVVNQRGIHIDIPHVESIVATLDKHSENMLKEFRDILGAPRATTKQHQVVKEWLELHGIRLPNMQKATITEYLATDNVPDHVRRALTIRQALAKASTGKFTAMLSRAQEDNRVRSTIMHHGASTGRPSGKAIQPLNMPRDCYKGEELEAVFEAFQAGDIAYIQQTYDDPFFAGSRCLRGSITAGPGNTFYCADYSSIEARGNSWAAGDKEKLEIFRQGIDVYKVAAERTFDVPYAQVDDKQRQVGKVQELALGYEGGIGAYVAMAGSYGLDLETLVPLVLPTATPDELDGQWGAWSMAKSYISKQKKAGAEKIPSLEAAAACDVLKQRWRETNYRIKASWKGYQRAAFDAIENPGQVFRFRRFHYRTWQDKNGNNYLVCQLPSGRLLYYFDPRIMNLKTDWGDWKPQVTHMVVESQTYRWVRRAVYGGLFCENCVQAICRDIHTEAMLRVERHGYPVVLHVYDEIVSETPKDYGSLEEFENLLSQPPWWAPDFPVTAEGWTGKRYRK